MFTRYDWDFDTGIRNTVDLVTCWMVTREDDAFYKGPLVTDAYIDEAASDNARML